MHCIDTSGWLDGWTRHYPRDVFPGVWDAIEEKVETGEIISSEEVYVELAKQDDDLHEWIKGRKQMLVAPEKPIQEIVAELLGKYPRLVDTLKNRSQADPFVIATAMFRKATVVTGELHGTPTRPRIPDVCDAEGVRCINFLQMLRKLGLTF